MAKLIAVALVAALGGGVFGAALTRTFGSAPTAPQIDVQTSAAVATMMQDISRLRQRVQWLSAEAKLPDF
jgi:hypothetical protein